MKELSIEEKAKRYDNALKVLHKYDGVNIMFTQDLKEEMFPELKEYDDKIIRKALIEGFKVMRDYSYGRCTFSNYYIPVTNIIAWLEKQDKHADFCDKIQIGDKVTRNEDGVLVNLSQLNRVAKKQGEQKPTEWSEEDEDILNTIINHFKVDIECTDEDDVVRWLKSLKYRYTWKPSEEQIQALEDQVHSTFEGSWQYKASKELLEQLKKL